MGRIYGQKLALSVLHHAHRGGRLPHFLLFYGEDGTGRAETALNLAKTLYCRKSPDGGFCDRCPDCVAHQLRRHAGLWEVSRDDRLPALDLHAAILRTSASEEPLRSRYALAGLIAQITARYKEGYYEPLAALKKSYPEGVVLSAKELETGLQVAGDWLERCRTPDFTMEGWDEAREALGKLQNGLDRSVLSVRALAKLQERLHRASEGRRVVILDDATKIGASYAAQLLKLLEEPPPDTVLILLAPHPARLADEVRAPLASRAMTLRFAPLDAELRKRILVEKFKVKPEMADSFLPYLEARTRPPTPALHDVVLRRLQGRIGVGECAEVLEREGVESGVGEAMRILSDWSKDCTPEQAAHARRVAEGVESVGRDKKLPGAVEKTLAIRLAAALAPHRI